MTTNKNAAPGWQREAAQYLTRADIIEQFRRAMQASGINPPGEIMPDGRLHRFSTNGARGDDTGWYLLHADGIHAGAFGDWRSGISGKWRADFGRRMTPEEEAEARRRIEKARAEAEAERQRRAKRAAELAANIWKAAKPVTWHPYLRRKGVEPTATLRAMHVTEFARRAGYMPQARGEPLEGMLLIAPVKGREHNPATLDLIDEHGRKSALAGGIKDGGFWATERLPDGDREGLTLLVGEGVATVLSASAATGHPAIAALSSGNLPAVAEVMRERYPAAALVILADLVKATGEPDPHAIEAARSDGGKLAIPDFGTDRDPVMTDMNDLFILDGPEAENAP